MLAGLLAAYAGTAMAQELPLFADESSGAGAPEMQAPAGGTPDTPAPAPRDDEPAPVSAAAAPDAIDETGERADSGSRALERLGAAVLEPMAMLDEIPNDAVAFVVSACPRELLGKLLAGAADALDTLTALGIEREILTLCRERQTLVTGIFALESELREIRGLAEAPGRTAPVGTAPGEGTSEAAALDTEGESAGLLSQLGEDGAPAGNTETAAAGAPVGQAPAGGGEPAPPPKPRYAWFSVIGSEARGLHAGVTDGRGWWFVSVGDALPGGVRIEDIVASPPGVRVSGAHAARLPEGAHPRGG